METDPDIESLRAHTVPLGALLPVEDRDSNGSEPGLQETLEWFESSGPDGSPTVVGLGEATHGTRECFELKAGLIRLLVEQCEVRTVAFEADVTATLALDEYVRYGEGDAVSGLDGLHKWMWQVESIRGLLEWIRAFNRGRPVDNRVRVRGVDLSRPAAPAAPLQSYFEAVDPEYAASREALAALEAFDGAADPDARPQGLDRAEAAAATLEDRLESRRQAYLDVASAERWALARHLCRVVKRTCDWHRVRHEQPGPHEAGMETRDRHMAANVEWCVEQDPNGRVALWAHNIHVERGAFDDGRVWTDARGMGEFLNRAFGERYTAVGFDVGRGTFRAVDATDSGDQSPRTFTVGRPREDSATARFESVGDEPWLLDVESAAVDPRLRDWFDSPRRIRCVGTNYDPEDPDKHYLRTELTNFDALVFADQSSPSRPVVGPDEL